MASTVPWCVGSVFPAANLLTGPSQFFVDACDCPKFVLNTGYKLNYAPENVQFPYKHARKIVSHFVGDFFTEDAVVEGLKECGFDNKHLLGNRLEGVQNRDGKVQLFFPVGKNNERIGSFLYSPELSCELKRLEDDEAKLKYSSSSTLFQPIQQIAAAKSEPSEPSDSALVPIAARTLYGVNFISSQMKDQAISFKSQGYYGFKNFTSHVIWNPHLRGEVSVILENGELNSFDLRSEQPQRPYNVINMNTAVGNQSSSWWASEYAWHPKNMIVASGEKVILVDLRQKLNSSRFSNALANVSCSSLKLSSYCTELTNKEYFTSIARADYDGMFQFAAASTKHLMIYDVRQPLTPLVKWEHRMQGEPPRLLEMHTISDLLSSSLSVSGRIVLASSYTSGDTHAFCYGPQPRSEGFNINQLWGDRRITENLFSWGLPIQLRDKGAPSVQNIRYVFESHAKYLDLLHPINQRLEKICGILNYSPNPDLPNFTMLYLTGNGSIMSQNFTATEKLEHQKYNQALQSLEESIHCKTTKKSQGWSRLRLTKFINYFYSGLLPKDVLMSRNEDPMDESPGLKDNIISEESQTQRVDNALPSDHNDTLGNVDKGPCHTFQELDAGLCPVKLSFEETGSLELQNEEIEALTSLKQQFQNWQKGFQPYKDYTQS